MSRSLAIRQKTYCHFETRLTKSFCLGIFAGRSSPAKRGCRHWEEGSGHQKRRGQEWTTKPMEKQVPASRRLKSYRAGNRAPFAELTSSAPGAGEGCPLS